MISWTKIFKTGTDMFPIIGEACIILAHKEFCNQARREMGEERKRAAGC